MEQLLANNSASMKTFVETFIVEETAPLIYDNEQLDKWNEHVQALGLHGQQRIATKEKSPIPFLFMNEQLIAVFETLCPTKVKVADFDKAPIPVEILDLIALSKREEYFDSIEIWFDEKSADPACVGLKKNTRFDASYPSWSRGMDKFLIGKWSDVKASFSELFERAKARFKHERLTSYLSEQKKH